MSQPVAKKMTVREKAFAWFYDRLEEAPEEIRQELALMYDHLELAHVDGELWEET